MKRTRSEPVVQEIEFHTCDSCGVVVELNVLAKIGLTGSASKAARHCCLELCMKCFQLEWERTQEMLAIAKNRLDSSPGRNVP